MTQESTGHEPTFTWSQMQKQIELAVKKEREACANLCWKSEDDNAFIHSYNGKRLDLLCAEQIRARGEA